MVVAHHARHYFPHADSWSDFGSRGVDIFFVISGFIMAHTTRRFDPGADRGSYAGDFLLRRVLRVVPLYWLALLWTTKRDWASGHPTADLARDLAFVPHFHPVYTDGIFPLLVPGWTINYEMFFYALFAATLLAGRRHLWLLAGVLVALVATGAARPASAPAIFYTRSVVLEFAFGIVVQRCLARWPDPLPTWAAIGITVIGFAGLALPNDDDARGLLDGPFAALIVWSAVQWTARRRWSALHLLGDASYSIYLFHLSTLAVSGWLLRKLLVVDPTAANIAIALACEVAVAATIGVALHLTLERPFLEWTRRRLRPPAATRAPPAEGR